MFTFSQAEPPSEPTNGWGLPVAAGVITEDWTLPRALLVDPYHRWHGRGRGFNSL